MAGSGPSHGWVNMVEWLALPIVGLQSFTGYLRLTLVSCGMAHYGKCLSSQNIMKMIVEGPSSITVGGKFPFFVLQN